MVRTISVLFVCLLWGASAGFTHADETKITPDVVYGHKDGMALVMHVYRPAKANGAAVVQINSSGYFSTWEPTNRKAPLVGLFLDRGYTVFSVFHGSNPKYTVPEIVGDMRRAVRFIRLHAADYEIDPQRLGAIGTSAGGHLALMLATTGDDGKADARDEVSRVSCRVAAAVAIAAPSDLLNMDQARERLLEKGPVEKALAERLKPAFAFDPALVDSVSPRLNVTDDDAPTLLIHGDKDELVSIDHSHRIVGELQVKSVPTELIVMEGIGHHAARNPAEAAQWDKAFKGSLAWFDKYLVGPEPQAKAAQAEPAKAGTFDSAGVKIHYVVEGAGPPVILVHGFTGSVGRDWQRSGILSKLSQSYQVIAFDHRGHGESEKLFDPKQYGAEMANDVLRLLDHLKIDKAHIVGYSLGGAITEYLLVNHPHRFFTATIGGMGWVRPDDERVALLDEFATAVETGKGLRSFLERAQSVGNATAKIDAKPKDTAASVNGAIQAILTNNPRALMACIRGIPALAVSEEQLKANKVPALAIIGGVDPWRATVDDMEKVLANLQVKVIDGTDHESCPISPQFVAEIQGFLAAHPEAK